MLKNPSAGPGWLYLKVAWWTSLYHACSPILSQAGCWEDVTFRMVTHRNRLPEELVDAPCLSVLKRHLDNAPNNTLQHLFSPEVVMQLDLMITVWPFQLNYEILFCFVVLLSLCSSSGTSFEASNPWVQSLSLATHGTEVA